ncbi:MAG: hypothetical protein HWQ38_26825 [Nostoc sp. NMS7]|uniref:hypothetical protein n=1 Tax=Nostoc sp. NMS7 TaxID=2815391 RepID=UPI0025F969D9|nr:hypothetical protein [Nostoc sp. NMS7]MBN3949885.1 hypothetical protein [Nostoc sp. NMS7]
MTSATPKVLYPVYQRLPLAGYNQAIAYIGIRFVRRCSPTPTRVCAATLHNLINKG